MPVALTVQLDVRVFTEQDAATASSNLVAAGFQVADPFVRADSVRRFEALLRDRGDERSFAWPADAHVLTASIAVSVEGDADGDESTRAALDVARAKLDAAIAPIERDPEVQWQIERLDSIERFG